MEEKLKGIIDNGWEFSLNYRENSYMMFLCRPEWVTNILYQSYPLPTFTNSSLKDVIDMAYQYVLN